MKGIIEIERERGAIRSFIKGVPLWLPQSITQSILKDNLFSAVKESLVTDFLLELLNLKFVKASETIV